MSAVTATIVVGGRPLDPEISVISLSIVKRIHRIPRAEIRLADGSSASQEFALSDSSLFEPGQKVEIRLRYESRPDHTVFDGVVTRQTVAADRASSSLTVELADPAIKLTRLRRSVVHRDQSDADAIKRIVGDAGLEIVTEVTKPVHEELVQYQATDWDFIASRADANGLTLTTEGGVLTLQKISLDAKPIHTFTFGLDSIHAVEMELDGPSQVESFESTGWDLASMATVTSEASPFSLQQGDSRGDQTAKSLGLGTAQLAHSAPIGLDELQAWADGRLRRSRLALLRGTIDVPGIGDLTLLDPIEIEGIGTRYNGTTVVTGVTHRVSRDGWTTEVRFGLSPLPFAEARDIEEVPAAGLLPPVSGLQIGVVTEFEEDPLGEHRVRVNVVGIDAVDGGVWARVASPDAGEGRGLFFRPEINDEVVLGFVNNDPRQPVVIGSLFGSVNGPPPGFVPTTEDNVSKGLVTKSGVSIIFDDEKKSLTIETAAGNKLVVDDDAAAIDIADQHGNTITMSESGIVVSSASDVSIEASGDLTLEAGGNVEIKGTKVDVK